jgi:DUF4097 and DUF4098 domain-containing protein YvlB
MKTELLAIAAGLAATLLVPDARAQTLDTTVSVRPGARFELQNISGTVQVRASRRSDIRIHAEYDRARIEIDASPMHVQVRTIPRRGMGDADYTIDVPVGTGLTVNAVSSDIDVRDVCGEAELQSVSGDVTLACAQGNVSVMSVSGDVNVRDVRGRLEVTSTSGDVTVLTARGDVVAAHSVSGDISLERVESQDVGAETVSGEVGFSGPIREGGRYRFQSHSGDLTIRPDGALNATISVSTFSGDLDSDFPVTLTPGRGIRPRDFEFTVGSGKARLSLSSFSGTIYLRRGGPGGRPEEER